MIKITSIPSKVTSDTHLILIPGGPGLSSLSIRGFDLLANKFNLHYVDFPGTNGNPYDKDRSFVELSEMLLNEVKRISGKVFVVGHSFGGFFASEISLWLNVDGLICVATPFSQHSLFGANQNYSKKITNELKAAENDFESSPTDKNFSKWLSLYGEMYFAPHNSEKGKLLLLNDPSSAKGYLNNTGDSKKMEPMLKKLAELNMSKLFIAGKEDGLINISDLEKDASHGNFIFKAINNANHFVMFDQPEQVARVIENFIATNMGE